MMLVLEWVLVWEVWECTKKDGVNPSFFCFDNFENNECIIDLNVDILLSYG
jgi:hypothetical protein